MEPSVPATRLAEHGQQLGAGYRRLSQRRIACHLPLHWPRFRRDPFISSGKTPRFAWATSSVASRVRSCRTGCGGRPGGFALFLSLATGCTASRRVKGKGYARYPHPFPTLRFGLRLPVPPLPPLPAKQRQERCSQADGGSRGWCGPQPRRARTRPLDAAGAPHAMPGGRSSGPKARNPCSRGSRRRGWRVQRGKASLETTMRASTRPIQAIHSK